MAVGSGASLGFDVLLGFADETTWGTKVTATSFMEFRSESLKKNIEEEVLESLGTGRSMARRVQKQVTVEGSIMYDLHPVDGIALLKHAMMGSVTSALVGTAAAYMHTFTTGDLSTITQKGISFEVKPQGDTTTAFYFTGCRVNSMKMSAAINEPIKCELEFVGKDGTTGAFATTTAAYSEVPPFLFQDGTFAVGGTTENIISFELTLENNLQSDESARSLGDTTLTNLPPGRRKIMLSITQRFDTTTAWDRFIAGSATTIRLRFDTGQTIGSDSGGTTYSMQIDLNKIYYNQAVPEISDAGILTHEVEISAISDTVTSAGTDMIITVANSVTSYA